MSKKKKKTAGTVAPKKVKKDDEDQSKRFVETAKELAADESGKPFNKAIESIRPDDNKE